MSFLKKIFGKCWQIFWGNLVIFGKYSPKSWMFSDRLVNENTLSIYEDGYLRLRLRGGVYEFIRVPHHPEWSDRPKNPDSYSPWMTWDGGFDRFEKFSFFAKIGRSEVEKVAKSMIFLYKLQWGNMRNWSKTLSQVIQGLYESGFLGRSDHSR